MYDDFKVGVIQQTPHPAYVTVSLGHRSQVFLNGTNGYTPLNEDGATLIQLADNSYIYQAGDGVKWVQKDNQIIYPNGFTVTIHREEVDSYVNQFGTRVPRSRIQSVTTNTGLQLKYDYRADTFPSYPCDFPFTDTYCRNEQSEFHFASKITAINNVHEYCDPKANSCNLSQTWPSANFGWPLAKDMFALHGHGAETAKAVFTITDPEGVTTQYTHERFGIRDPDGRQVEGLVGTADNVHSVWKHVSRVTKVKEYTSPSAFTTEYTYKDYIQAFPGGQQGKIIRKVKNQLVETARMNDDTYTYNFNSPDTPHRKAGSSIGPRGTHAATLATFGVVDVRQEIRTPDATVRFNEASGINEAQRLTQFGKQTLYEYDSRGNMTKRTQVASDGTKNIVERAGYATTCTNLKVCNQPLWVEDANGNRTDYRYHTESGQVASITKPANRVGIRAKTQYTYSPYYAYFKDASGNPVRAESPVWLLFRETSCTNSTLNGGDCSTSTDKVVVEYDYGKYGEPKNLWPLGKSITANGKTQRTCYEYNAYGFLIGQTEPNANLASCH